MTKRRRPKRLSPRPKQGKTIFRASFRHWRSGRILYARDYGLKGFPIG